MYELYKEGNSLEKVGLSFSLSRQSVYSRFKRKNLELRTLKRKPFIIVDGYKFTINRDGYYECTTIDRLMLHNHEYEKINGLIPDGYEIHHIDHNKTNNNIENLMILTPKEHTTLHSIERKGYPTNRKVICVETGEIFHSIAYLSKIVGKHQSNVSKYYIDGGRKINGYTYEKIN